MVTTVYTVRADSLGHGYTPSDEARNAENYTQPESFASDMLLGKAFVETCDGLEYPSYEFDDGIITDVSSVYGPGKYGQWSLAIWGGCYKP